jgi:hypothetical protein
MLIALVVLVVLWASKGNGQPAGQMALDGCAEQEQICAKTQSNSANACKHL